MKYPTIWPHFFTATILNWKDLLKDDEYKDIIIECLKFLVDEKELNLMHLPSGAIMSISSGNHYNIMHLHKYKLPLGHTLLNPIKKKLAVENPEVLEQLRVNKYDRTYKIWKREPLSIEFFTEKAFLKKWNTFMKTLLPPVW